MRGAMTSQVAFLGLVAMLLALAHSTSAFSPSGLQLGSGAFVQRQASCSSSAARGGRGGARTGLRAASAQMEFLGFKLSSLGSIADMIQKCEASHILVTGPNSLSGCRDLKELVEASIDFPAGVGLPQAFAQVAEKYSACPSSTKGGSLGSFKPGQMVTEFDEVAFGRQVGVMHGPIETKFGHHLILIHSRQGAGPEKKSGGCG